MYRHVVMRRLRRATLLSALAGLLLVSSPAAAELPLRVLMLASALARPAERLLGSAALK